MGLEGPGQNRINGTTEFRAIFHNVPDAATFVAEVLSQPNVLRNITGIEIQSGDEVYGDNTTQGDSNPDEDTRSDASARSRKSNGSATADAADTSTPARSDDPFTARLCTPLIQLMESISQSDGSLRSFSWTCRDGFYGTNGVRPPPFWKALYAYARTLQVLDIGYFTHELQHALPPQVTFPALKKLHITAHTAHGDDGTAVENLLKGSPNLEELNFEWPGCSLETCQVRNVSWDYSYPHLKRLDLSGYDFAPQAFAAFVTRCPNVEIFTNDVDTEVDTEKAIISITPQTMPKLRTLHLSYSGCSRTLGEYFKDSVDRPISEIKVESTWDVSFQLGELAGAGRRIRDRLKYLEVGGTESMWRLDEPDLEDDEETKRAWEEGDRLTMTCKALRDALPLLQNVRELRLIMESENTSIRLADGAWGNPPPMSEGDLRIILSLLPSRGNLQALRVSDTAAEGLAQGFLDDLPAVPDALDFLYWEGKERMLYSIEREGRRVRAVVSDSQIQSDKVERGLEDWIQDRVLERE